MSTSQTRIPPFWKQCFVSAAVCSDVIGHGCIIGYPAVLLPQLQSKDSPIRLSENDESWIASVLGIAMLFGIFVTPPIMGRLGRKVAHYIVILEALTAWFMIAAASSVKELIIARILHGLSFGMFSPLRSVIIGEYTSPKNRGAFLAAISLAQGFGIFLAHLSGSLIHWQWTALICVCFSFISLVMTIFSPESPSWLADKGRYDECRKAFHWLRGFEEENELEEMIEARIFTKNASHKKKNNIKNLLSIIKKKEFYKPVLTTTHAYCMLSFSGSMTFAAFSTTILGLIMGPAVNVHLWMVALDSQRILTSILTIFLINKTKRRKMTFATLGLCIGTHFVIAAYVYAKKKGFLYFDSLWIPGILINLHYISIGTGMVPLPGVILGEVFPIAYRNIGGSIAIGFYSVFMFLVLKTFNMLVDNIGLYGTYVVYGGLLMYCFTVMWFFLSETKGKTLQEIEDEYKGITKCKDEIKPLAFEMSRINVR